jgi:2-polyprenyl-3-methyl-5-hydroxy-6-metoxy-1,4-benzoquinol methylase
MLFTGERPTTDRQDHIESSRLRYHSIVPFCLNKSILDFGCGIGSGTYYLSQFAKQIVGYDCCDKALKEAQQSYHKSNLSFCSILPDITKFDIISMVESIEHLERNEAINLFLEFSKRNSIVLTTPNGDVFPYHPSNPSEYIGFHKWHFTFKELDTILKSMFEFVEIYGHMYDPVIQKFTSYTVVAS